jgi:hypothetical protein
VNVKHLVILTFPLSETEAETKNSGKALFVKHARKNILTVGDTVGERTVDYVNTHLKPTETHASDAWLVQMKNSTALRGDFDGSHYDVVAQTAPFPPAAFDQDLGVYIVAHNQGSIARLAIGPGDVKSTWLDPQIIDANEKSAAGLVNILEKLGLVGVKKLVLVMCQPAEAFVERTFLTKLVIRLHDAGSHPKVVGWDIPFTVVDKTSDPNYGRKEGTGVHTGLLAAGKMRKEHKFTYVFRSMEKDLKGKGSFEDKFKEMTKQDVKQGKIIHNVGTATSFMDKSKQMTKVKADVVQRVTHSNAPNLKYTATGWSL